MGFSPGEFYNLETESELHWEGKGSGRIYLWNHDESKIVLNLTKEQARKAADQLILLVQMSEEDRL